MKICILIGIFFVLLAQASEKKFSYSEIYVVDKEFIKKYEETSDLFGFVDNAMGEDIGKKVVESFTVRDGVSTNNVLKVVPYLVKDNAGGYLIKKDKKERMVTIINVHSEEKGVVIMSVEIFRNKLERAIFVEVPEWEVGFPSEKETTEISIKEGVFPLGIWVPAYTEKNENGLTIAAIKMEIKEKGSGKVPVP